MFHLLLAYANKLSYLLHNVDDNNHRNVRYVYPVRRIPDPFHTKHIYCNR